ncbi:MAG: tetratricopeptide repeat protein [Cyclobacteriaceae bacterium]
MKTIKILTILIFFLPAIQVNARQSSSDNLTYTAYMKNSLSLWEKAVKSKQSADTESSDKTDKLDLAMTYYGYMGATVATENEEAFKKYLDPAKDMLKQMIEDYPEWGEPKAVLSSVMGLEMAFSPLKGAFLGMKSSSLMSEAMKQNPESPLVLKLYAGSKQYTPAMWGGDKKLAAEYMQKSIEAYEKQGVTEKNWLYADALANLGIVYAMMDKKQEAAQVYNKALVYEPDFQWVRYSLMPELADNDKN